jgi:hypothetical protein
VAGDPAYPLLTGFDGILNGFSALEESEPPAEGSRVKVLAALGVPPPEPDENAPANAPAPEQKYVLTASRLGAGLVIRVGLPQWTQRLRDVEVAQITRNIADLLRGAKPKIRSTR